jgi:hypothetical protein
MSTPAQNSETNTRARERAVENKLLSQIEKALTTGNDPKDAINNLATFNGAVLTGLRVVEYVLDLEKRINPPPATEATDTATGAPR